MRAFNVRLDQYRLPEGEAKARLYFQLQPPLVTDRFALGGIRVDLATAQTKVAQLQHTQRLRQQHHLNKQRLALFQKAPPKVGKRVVVRRPVSRYERESRARRADFHTC